MDALKNIVICTKNECTKILGQKKYIVVAGITVALTILTSLLGMLPGSAVSFLSQNYPYTVLSVLSYAVCPFLTFMLMSELVSGECEKNELKVLLTSYLSRTEMLLGKLIAVCIYSLCVIIANLVVSTVIVLIMFGFFAVNIVTIILSLAVTIFPILAVASFALMISSFCHRSSASFGFSTVGYCAAIIIGLFFSKINVALFTDYMAIFKMLIGKSVPALAFVTGICVLLLSAVIFTSTASLKFEKKEF